MIQAIEGISSLFNNYVLLHLLRKDVVQDLLHLLPKLGLLVLEMGGHDVVALQVHLWVARIAEKAIGATVRGGEGVNFDLGLGGHELLRMEDVEDGAGVVDGREGELVVVVIHYLELLQHVVNCLREWDVLVSFEVVEDVLGGHVLVGHFQGYHHQRNLSLKAQHLVEGMGVKEYVELSSRGDVALADGSSHHHDLCYLLLQLRVSEQQDAYVGKRASINPNDLAIVSHDPRVYLFEASFEVCFFGRLGQMHSSQSIGAVHMFCEFHLSFDEGIRSCKDGNVSAADVVEHIECVLSGIGEAGVAGRGGNAQQIELAGVACVDDGEGVVEAGVTVQPNGCLLLGLHFWIYFQINRRHLSVALIADYHTESNQFRSTVLSKDKIGKSKHYQHRFIRFNCFLTVLL